jgi:hypothetical protein
MAIYRAEATKINKNDNGHHYPIQFDKKTKRFEITHSNYILSKTECSHSGLVLNTLYKEQRVMSDVYADVLYAQVWDEEKQEVNTIYVGCPEMMGNQSYIAAIVDATDEVKVKAEKYRKQQEEKRLIEERKREEERKQKELYTPSKGKTISVFKGRKVSIGTEGIVFWVGNDRFGNTSVGFKDKEGKTFWSNIKNVKVINPEIKKIPGDNKKKENYTFTFLKYETRGKAYKVSTEKGTEFFPQSQVFKIDEENKQMEVAAWLKNKKNI